MSLRIALVVSLVLAHHTSSLRIEGPFGRGAAQVWIVLPQSRPRSIVVFGHGWKTSPPTPPLAWVDQFRPWLEHLAAREDVVIFPRYQLGINDSAGVARVRAYRAGLESAFARIHARVPVVAAGYSYGASLALSYAANARAWSLPVPRAVDAVFPAGIIPGSPLPALPSSTRVLIQVGQSDTEAGAAGASGFWAWLSRHPRDRKRYEVVTSRPGFIADHAAPKESSATARRAFWMPLDALVRAVTRLRPGR